MPQAASTTSLVRGFRRWDLVALMINVTIGAGIFGLPSKVFSLSGTYSLLAFLVCALLVLLVILCFAEVSSRFTETGGVYLYAHKSFGPIVGFEVGWLMWLQGLTGFAALSNLFVSYSSYFWPIVASGLWRTAIISLITASLATVNVIGIRETAVVNNAFTIAKLIPILLFLSAGLFFINPDQISTRSCQKLAMNPFQHQCSYWLLLMEGSNGR